MRVTTDLFVSAIVRRVFSAGGFAAVEKRGALEAGAVFFLCRDRLGQRTLYGPASQSSYETGSPDDRRYIRLLDDGDGDIDARIEKERRFDSDIWIVEIEPANAPVEEFIPLAKP